MVNSRLLMSGFGLALLIIIYLIIWALAKYGPKLYRFGKSISVSIGSALINNEYIARFLARQPKLLAFLKRRSSRQSFRGLTATLLGLAFLYILFLFLGLIKDFVTSDLIVAADTRLNNLMLLFRSDYYVKIFLAITTLGNAPIIISLLLVVSLLLWLWQKKIYIIPFWISVGGADLFSSLGKLAFERPRPPLPVYLESSYSFPSGHATIAVAFYGFLIYFCLRNTKKLIKQVLILLIGLLIIIAIGFSRIYLGVHYLSDVLVGYLLGGLWLIIGISLVEWQLDKKNQSTQATAEKSSKKISRTSQIITILLLLGELLFSFYNISSYHPTQPAMAEATPIYVNDILALPTNFTLPKYTETITAKQQEPLSFIVSSANDQTFQNTMQQAGWLLADPINDYSLGEITRTALFNLAYPRAPMTPSFWNGEPHTFGFEKATAENSVREREHARFWKTNFRTKNGDAIYVGTASLDTGIKWAVTHKIAPDIDTEREHLFRDFWTADVVKDYKKTVFVPPTLGRNFSGDEFFTDGNIYTISLK